MIWKRVILSTVGLWGVVSAVTNSTESFTQGGEIEGQRRTPEHEHTYCGEHECHDYCKKEWTPHTVTVTVTASSSPCPNYPTPAVSTVTSYLTITQNQTITETTKTTTTDISKTTDYTTTTVTKSYPYNVTITDSHGYPVYSTVWKTEYIISKIYIPKPTTKTEISTVISNGTITVPTTKTATASVTEYSIVTYTTSKNYTIIETKPVTVISSSTIYTTITEVSVSTFNVTKTVTESYPVVTTQVVTTPTTTTETELSISTAISTTEILVTLDPSTITTTISGTPTTIIIPASTITATRTLPPVTLPASTITSVVTSILPGQTITTTLDGTTRVTTLPGSTTTYTTTITRDLIPLCPAPTNSGPVTPQDTGPNALWGCSPGYICNVPKPQGCALYGDPPAQDFLCDAKYCTPAPPFSEVVWPADKASYYPVPPAGYFNLNPKAFGLDYTIFTKTVIVTYTTVLGSRVLTTITTGQYESQASLTHYPPATPLPLAVRALRWLSKRDETIIPSVCYASCNNCYLEAQRVGKSTSICAAGSTFSRYRASCDACVEANGDLTKRSQQTYFNPRIREIVGFCDSPGQNPVNQAPAPAPVSTSTLVQTPQAATRTSVEVVTQVGPTPSEEVVQVTTSTFIPPSTQVPTSTSSVRVPPAVDTSASTTSYQQVPTPSSQPNATTSYLQANVGTTSNYPSSVLSMLTTIIITICGALFL